MPSVAVGELQMWCEQVGDGPRLLLISGTGGDLRQRPNVLDSPLRDHLTVLTYDQRGLGRTSAPPGPWTMADYADDAAGLLAAVGWGPVAVMGISFGGMVAQELALRHAAQVSRLVLACTSAGGAGGASYPLHTLADLPADERIARSIQLSDTRLDDAWRARHPDQWDALVAMRVEAEAVGADEPGRAEGAARQLEARRGHDTYDRLPAVACPTLVCGGRFDGIAEPDNVQRLAAAIPGATLAMFDGGHLFLWQDPAAYPAVIDFLHDTSAPTPD